MIFAAATTAVVQQLRTDVPYSGAIGAIAVDPRDERRVLVASAAGGAFESTDGARTWTHVDALPSNRVEALLFLTSSPRALATTAQEFVAAGSGGVWMRDAAKPERWSRTTAVFPHNCPPTASAWGISVAPDGRIYVATDCGLAVGSRDGGTWRARAIVGGSPPYMSVVALGGRRVIVAGPNGFWVSGDDGATFRAGDARLGGITGIRGLAADPRGAGRAYAVDDAKQLFATQDGGATWRRIATDAGSFSCGGDAFVKAARSQATVALYFGNRCDTKVATFDARSEAGSAPVWRALPNDHADTRDLAFYPFSARPYLMSSDGGIHVGAGGTAFRLAAGAASGLDALQVNEVRGQYVGDSADPDLYFATQDNMLWALRAGAPPASMAWEGFYLGLDRRAGSDGQVAVTYAVCGGCKNGIAGRGFSAQRDWHDADSGQRAPVFIAPQTYVQQVGAPVSADESLAWSADEGATWRRIARIPQPMHGEPYVSGTRGDLTAIQPIQVGTNADGTQQVQLADVPHLGGRAALRYPAMRGFGSLGVTPASFAWYEVLGVDPSDPAHVIAADASDGDVKATLDGGDRWIAVAGLRALVSHDGYYAMGVRANDRVATLVSLISFCPDDASHVLIGTRAGGAYFSIDGGTQWERLTGSEAIVYATSAFWLDRCRGAWVSTYARGIWSVTFPAAAAPQTIVPSAPIAAGRAKLPPYSGAYIRISSGTVMEGERTLDPRDPLTLSVQNVPGAGTFALEVDGRKVADVTAGLPLLDFSSTPAFWPVGHHAVSLVDVSNAVPVTLTSTSFIVP